MGSADRSVAYALLPEAMEAALERIRRDRRAATHAIRPAFDHLLDHLCAPELNVGELVRVEGVVRSRFAERFHAATGMHARAYIEALRIEIACRLLKEPRIPVSAIGLVLGWQRRGSFCETFRRVMKTTPTAFRGMVAAHAKAGMGEPPRSLSPDPGGPGRRPSVEVLIQAATGTAGADELITIVAFLDRELMLRRGRSEHRRADLDLDRAFARGVWRLASQLDDARAERFLASSGVLVPEVFELLFEKTRTEGRQDRPRGVAVARLIVATVDRIPPDSLPAAALAALRVRAFAWLGNAHCLACDFRAAEDAFSAARGVLALLGEADAPVARAEYLDRKAALRWFESRFDEAYELAEQALRFGSACSAGQQVRMALQKAAIQAAQGDLRASCATLEEVTGHLDQANDSYLSMAAWINLTLQSIEMGHLDRAGHALSEAKRYLQTKQKPDVLRAEGLLAYGRGETAEGHRLLEKAREGFSQCRNYLYASIAAGEISRFFGK